MKRFTALCASLALGFACLAFAAGCACSSDRIPQIKTEPGVSRADNVPISALTFNRGDKVNIVGSQDGYYVVEYDDPDKCINIRGKGASRVMVMKSFVRLATEEPRAPYTIYSKEGAAIYNNGYLEGEPLSKPEVDTPFEVIDSFDRTLVVKLDGEKVGYLSSAYTGAEPEPEEEPEASYDSSYYYYYGSGSYSDDSSSSEDSGTSGWTGGAVDTSTPDSGVDGEDISLAAFSALSTLFVPEVAYADEAKPAEPTGEAVILADGTRSYLGFLARGEEVVVVSEPQDIPEGMVQLLVDDMFGLVPAYLIGLEGDEEYKSKELYAEEGAPFYADYLLKSKTYECQRNEHVTVLDDLGVCLVVEVNGVVGYMPNGHLSKDEYPEPEEPEYYGDYYYSYSYSSGGGDDGGSDDGGSVVYSQSVETILESTTGGGWTEEQL